MSAWAGKVRPLVASGCWLLVLGVVAGLAWVTLNRPVGSVIIEGELTKADRAAVRAALEPSLNTGLLRLDLDSVVAQVDALAWPQSISVRRVWPNQLVVGVVKQQVVAAWNDHEYLTSTGKIVTLATAPARGDVPLPKLRAAHASPAKVLEIYQRLAALTQSQQYDAQHQQRLIVLTEDSLGAWQVTLAPALIVKLGSAKSVAGLADRLRRFFIVRQQQPDDAQRTLRYADARYESGVALRWDALVAQAPTTDRIRRLQDNNL